MSKIIKITKSAEEYLAKLIQDKNELDLSIRIFISDPGTLRLKLVLLIVNQRKPCQMI
ncbi:MAG: hypothetical protein CM15mP108_0720 [Gammaproteobacteria bacterium]|nr:MAG: hypothetical protein CM15mP108_0720 [Gammaproteobacteria bacterium]